MNKEFYKKKLGNGLTVLFEKRKLPVVAVSASVKFGSAFESEKNKGISHFVEHLMFKGTKTREQQEISREIEKKGGILNAYTSEEVTCYWNKLPSKHIESGIDIASDLILNPKFDAVEFEREKGVIIEEIKMYHDTPRFYVPEKIKELLYKKPFGLGIAGKAETIKNMKRQEVVDLHDNNYTTDSMVLGVAGDADFDFICEKAEKIFPTTKRKIQALVPLKINKEEVEKRKGIDQAHLAFGFHSPSIQDVKRYDYEVMGGYLFDGMSSVLFQEIREKRGLAYAVKGSFEQGDNFGYCLIYVGTMKEKIKEIKEIILKEIRNLSKIEKKDLDEVKEQLIGMRKVESEDSFEAMNNLVQEEISGNAEEYYQYGERISNVKLEDVRAISKLKNFSSFSLIPG